MSKISIKQNRKGTFLDLSQEDFKSEAFVSSFANFSDEIEGFLSGTSVSLILPESTNDQEVLDKLRAELNKRNISLKSILASGESDSLTTIQEHKAEMVHKEENPPSEEKEIVDTSQLPETLYVEANLRSGQLIRYPGNVFILGDVNPSAEIIASGDIIVWGTLRGIAHAGAGGDSEAKVIAMKINQPQIRITNQIANPKLVEKFSEDNKGLAFFGKNKRKAGTMLPLLAKIENNEIIIRNYFK